MKGSPHGHIPAVQATLLHLSTLPKSKKGDVAGVWALQRSQNESMLIEPGRMRSDDFGTLALIQVIPERTVHSLL
jgi:hypothetical protein